MAKTGVWIGPHKQRLLDLLETPIKFGKIPEGPKRIAFERAETDRRIAAAFEFYDIPADSPEEAKWMTLAIYLLGAHFRGCRSFAKQPGGAPRTPQIEYEAIVSEFDDYCSTARPGTLTAHAIAFIKKRGGSVRIGKESISDAKAFLNMRRRVKKQAS